jgi:hypothetical protein
MGYASEASSNGNISYVVGISPYFSTSPAVPYEDVDSVVQAMNWLNNELQAGSCVLLHHAFLRWGELYLDKSHTIVHFETDINAGLRAGFENNFSSLFFVWWNKPINWYGINTPESFIRVQDFGNISVYVYEGVSLVGS